LKRFDRIHILKDALFTTLIVAILLGPFFSFILKGFSVEFTGYRLTSLVLCVFVGRLVFSLLLKNQKVQHLLQKINRSLYQKTKVVQTKSHRRSLIIIAIIALLIPFMISKYWLSVAIIALIYVLLGLGLNIVVGLAGLLDLGYVAFYAIGAYGVALSAHYLHLGFWSALPFAALLSALFGAILSFPVLRMHGDYLAIVTLGFGEIIRLILTNWASFTGGPNGIEVPDLTLFGLEFSRVAKQHGVPFHEFFGLPYDTSYRYFFIYFVLLVVVTLMLRFVNRLKQMPLGRAWEALREDEIACRSLGINPVVTKLAAFTLGAMIGGIGGVFFATFEEFINPASFTFLESALILSIVVLGGMGSSLGVVLAAILLTLLPELFRQFSEYRMLFFGSVMVLMMIWRPQGLIRMSRQWIAPKVGHER